MATAAPVEQSDSGRAEAAPQESVARLHLRQLAWSSLVIVLPVAYLAIAVGAVWWGAGLLWAALAAIALRRPSGARSDATTALSILRVGVALWVLATYLGQPSWDIAACGTVVAATAVLSEFTIRRLADAFVPIVSQMPGVRPAPPKLNLRRLTERVSLAALAVGVLLGALQAAQLWPEKVTAWGWLIAGWAMTVLPAVSLTRAVRRILAGRRIERTVADAVIEYAPEFVLYTSRPDDASYQVLMWLPYLQRTGRRLVIVARANAAAAPIASHTEIPVLVRRGVAELDDVVQPSVRAAFYVNASSGNGAFVRYNQFTHVYLGHGDSDKPPSYNPTHAMYDRIFAAGEAAIERYAAHGVNIGREKFDIVGRPQVEAVEPGQPGVTPQTVLYAPTWRGHVAETLLYSLPIGERIVAALLRRGMTVIFRPHPFSYDFPDDVAAITRIQALLRDDSAATGRQHLYGPAAETERGIIDCINASDAMVSDVSSVVSDYLFSEKPFAMVAGRFDPFDFVRDYPVAQAAYVIDGAADNVEAVLDQMLGSDPCRADRRRVRTHYLGDFDVATYSQAFVDACNRIIDTPAPRSREETDSVDEAQRTGILDRLRTRFANYGREFTFAFCAVAAFVLATAGLRVPAVVLATVLLGLIVILSRRGVLGVVPLNGLLGILAPARVLLALALLPAWPTGSPPWPLAAAVVAVVVLTGAEVAMRYAWLGAGTGAVHLPGAENPPPPRLPRGSVYVANLLTLLAAWLSAMLGGSPWFLGGALVLVVVAAVFTVLTVSAGMSRLSRLGQIASDLPTVIANYAPRFAVYFSSNIGADYQVGMWLPYFKRIGSRFLIVTRTVAMMEAISRLDPAPVVYRPTLRSLEDVLCPSLTTAFYVNNAVRNTHLIERRELTHVWLNHGDSEKPACFNPVHAIYDRLFVAGEAGIDRYARHGVHIPREKFKIVGRPQVEQITAARGQIATLEAKTVLYAPTWKGPYADTRVYSLPLGHRIVERLLQLGVTVIFRAHPFNENFPESRAAMRGIANMLQADRKRTGLQHLWGDIAQNQLSIEECFNASDAMVADVSAVVSDYLKSQKPYAIVAVGRTPAQLLADAPAARAAYVLREDLSNLDEVYSDLLIADPLTEARRSTKVYYLGDFDDEHYADGFLDAARGVIDRFEASTGNTAVTAGREVDVFEELEEKAGETNER